MTKREVVSKLVMENRQYLKRISSLETMICKGNHDYLENDRVLMQSHYDVNSEIDYEYEVLMVCSKCYKHKRIRIMD